MSDAIICVVCDHATYRLDGRRLDGRRQALDYLTIQVGFGFVEASAYLDSLPYRPA